ncbi:MAG TPA: FliA/WhiG family RNA polymerase sigma factor, partial [Chthoniobacterales bacterium]|nr:FliA/WhiG family RNA polymerase sigma factor [Chthoniobacterales bacterium]
MSSKLWLLLWFFNLVGIDVALVESRTKFMPMTAEPIASDSVEFVPNQDVGSLPSSPSNFESLLENHLPLVKTIVDRMKRQLPSRIDTEDLYSVGVTGLVAAAQNFRETKNKSFIPYASMRIRGAILDELRRMDWMSRSGRSKAKQLGILISRIEQEQGGAVGPEQLCEELNISETELNALMDQVRPIKIVSLDVPEEWEENEHSLHEIIPDDTGISAFENLERKELTELIAERIKQLPDVPKRVLAMYYYEGMKLADIAAAFGLTESRICQIHTQAVGQLRS